MDFVTDLHLHSKYSRAVSKDMVLPVLTDFAKRKGLQILSTGDWTHPLWLREIKAQLEESNSGLYKLKSEYQNSKSEIKEIYFILSVEIASIYSQKGRVHRIHNLVLSPSFATAEKINAELLKRGCNLSSDGRPIVGISSRDLLELILEIDERSMLIPAHIWTPWFSLYGANSGFDSIKECFGDMSEYIYGIETGLSSDPEMNWQIKDLDSRSILSFSDAHSPAKMGREATVLRLEEPNYENIRKAIIAQSKKQGNGNVSMQDSNRVLYTIEFYPEEGKYHYTGHRNCNIIQTPEETKEKGDICPICKRKLTVGVMHRVQDLANESVAGVTQLNSHGLKWFKDPKGLHPPFVKIVPLNEIIAESLGVAVGTAKVQQAFNSLCDAVGSEIDVLLKTPVSKIVSIAGEKVAEGIEKVRNGTIVIRPGFDGEYGVVKIWNDEKKTQGSSFAKTSEETQLGIDF